MQLDKKVKREEEILTPREDANAEKSNWHLRVAGDAVRPVGFEIVGSMACHIFANKFDDGQVTFAAQVLGDIPEIWSDLAWKELRRALMRKYNRKEKEVLK